MSRPEIWLDQGGTFTDCILLTEGGAPRVLKVPSSDDAPVVAIRALLALGDAEPVPPCDIRMGTTKTTNALLERKGIPCALVISRGFGELTQIGTQARPDIFDLEVRTALPLHAVAVEMDARVDASGVELETPNWQALERDLTEVLHRGITSIAVVCIFSHKNPRLEQEVGKLAERIGFRHVALSHQLVHEAGLLRRAETTVLDAYLTPLLREHFERMQLALPGSSLRIMQSSGELAAPPNLRGPASLLSGPAGGLIALAHVAKSSKLRSAIGFDMGGTSTDVARYAGDLPRVQESDVAGLRVVAPTLEIHTVAAGGGSLCRFDGARLVVGPESAGSTPGPLCYGAPGGEHLTVTDINLWLGRLQAERFPLPLAIAPVSRALDTLKQQLDDAGHAMSVDEIATGFLAIANANMARAVEQISIARGFDVREDALVVYGGAGGQHACAVAALLGMREIIFHPLAGVLSAFGMGLAEEGDRGVLDLSNLPLSSAALNACQGLMAQVQDEVQGRLAVSAALSPKQAAEIGWQWTIDAGYKGTDTRLPLSWDTEASTDAAQRMAQQFAELHQGRFGYVRPGHVIELRQLRAVGRLPRTPGKRLRWATDNDAPPKPSATKRIWFEGGFRSDVPVFQREDLSFGLEMPGPAYIVEGTGAIIIDPDAVLRVEEEGVLRVSLGAASLRRTAPKRASGDKADPVLLELIGNAFMNVAQEMGAILKATALSTNIRERLDFSCAVFDDQARLLANAPHIPVHLGAMAESVRQIARAHPHPRPGDAFATNDPAAGGSHLPDITVVTPVFGAGRQVLFFVANRGHHADIGGISPGSMPADSHTLVEEGVVLRDVVLVRDGIFDREGIHGLLTAGPFPARTPGQNIADLEAQLAANRHGTEAMKSLLSQWGPELLESYGEFLQAEGARQVRQLLAGLPQGRRRFEDQLDDGTPLGVTVTVSPETVDFVFDRTPEAAGNSNAPKAVVQAAILYVLRSLIGSRLPLNSGVLRPVKLSIPPRSLLDPGPERAVVSGNVETSQRLVDILLGALDAAAASQGTMNNVTFGNGTTAYYETLGGGMGATRRSDGASAVQCHMTNTRITDAEVLESRYPVRVVTFALRHGSGGAGTRRGGDGLVRELEFLAPLEVTLVTERRTTAPFGLHGGLPGRVGVNLLNGVPQPGRTTFSVQTGDRLRLETPGGGGWGSPP